MFRRKKNRASILSYYDSDYFLNFPDSIFNIGLYSSQTLSPQQNFVDLLGKSVYLEKSDDLLDVGCGSGKAAEFLANTYGCKVTGITISKKQIKDSAIILESPKVVVVYGDGHNIPFAEGKFNKAICLEAAFHFYDKKKFSEELHRVISTGGKIAIADITLEKKSKILQKDLMKCISKNKWNGYLESAGFQNIEIKSLGNRTFGPALEYFSSRNDLLEKFPKRHQAMLIALKYLKETFQHGDSDYTLITAKKK